MRNIINKNWLKLGILLIIGLFFMIDSPKVIAYGDCSQYGYAYDDGFGYCKCISGYVMDNNFMGNPYCVSGLTYCYDKYGLGSTYDYLSKSCECSSGYVWGTNILGKSECISGSQYCKDKYGYNSEYDRLSDKCECSYGYEMTLKTFGEGLECVSCFSKYGLHSSYNSLLDKCECDYGYTLNSQNQCVEKENNVYFILKELDADSKQAIIKSEYDYRYYLITYGYGCYDISFKRYINDQIVVNLGTDFDLDRWDKIVLFDDDETCDISSVEKVDSSYTLNSNDSNIYINSNISICPDLVNGYLGADNKCYCNLGYEWNVNIAVCVKTVTPIINSSLTNTKNNTVNVPEGAIIRAINGIDVYIVKYVGSKKFKRLVLSPSVFKNYGHLKWENLMVVGQDILDSFVTSDLVKAVGDDKIYSLYPQGDTGNKRLIRNNTVLANLGLDLDSIYEINSFDRDSYITGAVLE